MSKLNKVQRVARFVGVKSGRNSWFLTEKGINDPDNQNVKCGEHVSIALGCVEARDLPEIAIEALRPHFSNTFAAPLDKRNIRNI